MSNTHPARPRRIATIGRVTVVAGSGIALGILSAHLQADALAKATPSAAAAAAQQGQPKVVTVVRTKHVKSDPVVVYRQAPSSSSSTWSNSTSTSSNSTGPSQTISRAPAPAPATNRPTTTSTAS